MDLFIAIALLCHQHDQHSVVIKCQQSYVHCMNVKTITMSKEEALNKCIMEKK
jgi:hypothetical protein